jgi:hypothetical protein
VWIEFEACSIGAPIACNGGVKNPWHELADYLANKSYEPCKTGQGYFGFIFLVFLA